MAWVIDLDGVVWLGGRALPGATEALERLRGAGVRAAFVTNNSGPTRAELVSDLSAAGLNVDAADLATSSQAAATVLEPGTRAAVVGGDGITEALLDRGIVVVEAGDQPEVVVVGRSPSLDYDQLAAASTAIRRGARFVATNADATYPVGEDSLPGAGAVVAFIRTASGVAPEVTGKPEAPAVALVGARFGRIEVVVGDRPDTDGVFASRLGARFALVLSGVTSSADLPVTPTPDFVGADLAEVVDRLAPDRRTPDRGIGAARG